MFIIDRNVDGKVKLSHGKFNINFEYSKCLQENIKRLEKAQTTIFVTVVNSSIKDQYTFEENSKTFDDCKTLIKIPESLFKYISLFSSYLRFLYPEMYSKFQYMTVGDNFKKQYMDNLNYLYKLLYKLKISSEIEEVLNKIKDLNDLNVIYLRYETVYLKNTKTYQET